MLKLNQDNLLIVCPTEEKNKLLTELNKEKNIYNIKFMTKEEFKNNYYFSYDEQALYYLMHKYKYNLSVAKIYLESLYVIDTEKSYKSPKLNHLKELKKELIENNLLIFNTYFKKYLATKKIIVKNYFDLDKYEEDMLNYQFSIPKVTLTTPVYECKNIEEEVNHVCLQIEKLLAQGVDINNIYLTNISTDYLYTLKKIFSYYNIPINIDMQEQLYGTKVVKDFLTDNTLDLENPTKQAINKKLLTILSQLSFLDENTVEYKLILKDKLKHTYITPKQKTNAVNIKDLYTTSFSSSEYVFVLGFNQDFLPKTKKDINYLDDSLKMEVPLYKTNYLNARNKELTVYLLSQIENLYLSYKLASPFNTYYKSSLIDEEKLEIIPAFKDSYNYSDIYNKIRLGEMLDEYYLYGTTTNILKDLYTTYDINYRHYSNKFTGINKDLYLENLPYPLKLSYTSLNTYNECKFKYYIKNVLKLEPFSDTFASFIGSMYHNILSLYKNKDFDFEKAYQNYLAKRELSLKEKVLLVRIKKDLLELLKVIKEQELLTGYDAYYFEKKAEVPIQQDIEVIFTGYIDKIMFYQKIDDTYFSIIDYKSGYIDTHIEPMKYGLHMQLPIYLFLIHYSNIFSNPIFTGIYYQNILFNYPTWDENILKTYKNRFLLQGYSTDNVEVLARFDSTYEKSELIKSLAYKEDKGFSTYSKILSNDTLYELITFTKKHIKAKTQEILAADFSINPKVYAGKNVSCEFCPFIDICYMKEDNLTYLDKVLDLSFLGGEK